MQDYQQMAESFRPGYIERIQQLSDEKLRDEMKSWSIIARDGTSDQPFDCVWWQELKNECERRKTKAQLAVPVAPEAPLPSLPVSAG
jgi:hypothetical protein